MALAAYADGQGPSAEERAAVDRLVEAPMIFPFNKTAYRDSALHNCGVHTPAVHRAAAYLTDRIFEVFHRAARRLLPPGLPLLITGGCALNCDWNRRWHDSGLFSEVFAAPCGDDSGSAIGTCVDALTFYGHPCALEWDVYSGAPFDNDVLPASDTWTRAPADPRALAEALLRGDIVAWVDGRSEIGPRALGHRSLLATPLSPASHTRLNDIKRRESYRPIAPCCLDEDLGLWFDDPIDDPYMLYVSRVTTDRLPAVTHVDGTARVQSVGEDGPRRLRSLLQAFRDVSGVGVLCNTSLNFPGTGFLNTASDVFGYAAEAGVEHVVIEDDWYTRR